MDEVYKGFVVNTTRIKKYLIYFQSVVFCIQELQNPASRFTLYIGVKRMKQLALLLKPSEAA